MLGYGCQMTDTIDLLKERQKKAEAKVLRYEKTLETAKNELSDIITTLRVLGDIGESAEPESMAPKPSVVGERQKNIMHLISESQENARAPADIFESYKVFFGDDVSIDTFRTTIWRMKDRVVAMEDGEWCVYSDNGQYWKVRVVAEENEAPEAIASGASEVGGGARQRPIIL